MADMSASDNKRLNQSPDSVLPVDGPQPPKLSLPPPATAVRFILSCSELLILSALVFSATALVAACLIEDYTTLCHLFEHPRAIHLCEAITEQVPWGVFVAGFAAQLVDGSLGMGYGLTSSTVLLAAGLSSTTASSVVHFAQLGTTFVSGVAHHRAGNVEPFAVNALSAYGFVAAFAGATLLSSLGQARILQSCLLLAVGAYVLARNASPAPSPAGPFRRHAARPSLPSHRLLATLGLLGGFVDATGGGGGGPVATSGLLADGKLGTAKAVGTVSLSEFFVTLGCVLGFLVTGGGAHAAAATAATAASSESTMRIDLVLALLGGGLLAAPLAPALVKYLPERLLGCVVGGFICLTNARVLLRCAGASEGCAHAVYVAVGLATWQAAARSLGRGGCLEHFLLECSMLGEGPGGEMIKLPKSLE